MGQLVKNSGFPVVDLTGGLEGILQSVGAEGSQSHAGETQNTGENKDSIGRHARMVARSAVKTNPVWAQIVNKWVHGRPSELAATRLAVPRAVFDGKCETGSVLIWKRLSQLCWGIGTESTLDGTNQGLYLRACLRSRRRNLLRILHRRSGRGETTCLNRSGKFWAERVSRNTCGMTGIGERRKCHEYRKRRGRWGAAGRLLGPCYRALPMQTVPKLGDRPASFWVLFNSCSK